MRKNYLISFIAIIGLIAGLLPLGVKAATMGSTSLGGFWIVYPSSPLALEEGRSSISWSADATVTAGTSIELIIENETQDAAFFANNSTWISSTWSGNSDILLNKAGKFTLKANVWKNGNKQSRTLQAYEIKATPVTSEYKIDGPTGIFYTEMAAMLRVVPMTNVTSTEWTTYNDEVYLYNKRFGYCDVMISTPGSYPVYVTLTLTSGEKKTLSYRLVVREHPLANVAIAGDSIIVGGQEVKYKVQNLPESGVTVKWEIDNTSGVIVSGQNTDEVTIKATDMQGFKLSANVEYSSLKKTVSKDIAVTDPLVDVGIWVSDPILFPNNNGMGSDIKLVNCPKEAKVTWSTSTSNIIIGLGYYKIYGKIPGESEVIATVDYNGFKKTLSKDVYVSPLKISVPETIEIGQNFTCKLDGMDEQALKYPVSNIEWNIFEFKSYDDENELLTKISFTDDNSEMIYKANNNGLLHISATVIFNGKTYIVGASNHYVRINIGDMFMSLIGGGVGGMSYAAQLFLMNIPDDIDYEKTEWLKVNQNDNTYEFWTSSSGYFGVLPYNTSLIITNSYTEKAQLLARIYYKDGRTEDILSPVMELGERPVGFRSLFTPQSTTITPQEAADKVYNIEVYSLPDGTLRQRTKNAIGFDINNTFLPTGIYLIKKTDKEGNITSQKVHKK